MATKKSKAQTDSGTKKPASKKTGAKEAPRKKAPSKKAAKANQVLAIEDKLWEAADKLRGSMEAAEYKHVVLGLIFLKYISDAFQALFEKESADENGEPEHPDTYLAENVFWVPKKARWPFIEKQSKQPNIGQIIDEAMEAIEKDNGVLRGVLPKQYNRPALDKHRLGELIDMLSSVDLLDADKDDDGEAADLLGRVYEYFLGKFASAEGKKAGEFYTPASVVRTLVAMIEPYKGRVYDPCCGSGGMFVQSARFIASHGGNVDDISIYGQEWVATTWRLAKMNLAIRHIEANVGDQWADTFRDDKHKTLKADFILANPPFNIKDWGGQHLKEDVRWKYGTPPEKNANFAWLQHMVHHLAPGGVAGVVLANGSMSSTSSGEGGIRERMIEGVDGKPGVVDCMVALPNQLFFTAGVPVCLWILARDKGDKKFRDRRDEVLFIDARKLGQMVSRVHKELSKEDVARIADTYHAWRGQKDAGTYEDVKGFCKAATVEEVRAHKHVLTPGRYVGAEDLEDDDEPFEERFPRLVAKLEEQFAEGARLEKEIRANLDGLELA